MELYNTIQTLNMIGELCKDQYKAKIKKGAYASGKLYNSIDYKLNINPNGNIILYLTMKDYWIYVENGRLSGKMPPISAIKKWMKYKGLPQKQGIEYRIARNISKKGIKPKPYVSEIKNELKNFVKDIEQAFQKDLDAELNKMVENNKQL